MCIERARLLTESYRHTEAKPVILRQAKAFYHVLSEMTVFILDDELIVGHQTSKHRGVPVYPETDSRYLREEIDLFPIRDQDRLIVLEKDKKELLNEILPFWENRNTGDLVFERTPDETKKVWLHEHGIFHPELHVHGSYGHWIPDFKKILEEGMDHQIEVVTEKLRSLNPLDPLGLEKREFYESLLICCDAAILFANRYAQKAWELSKNESDLRRKKELELIATVCERVPAKPARTFHEALQAYWFTMLLCWISQSGTAISCGRFDQLMYPYFRRDIERGTITKDEAHELLEALWIKHTEIMRNYDCHCARYFAGWSVSVHMDVGGMDARGLDATNELTYMCMDAEEKVANTQPNFSLRVHDASPQDLLLRAIEVVRKVHTGKPAFFNDDAIVPALLSDGVPLEGARDYGIIGCVEMVPQQGTCGITNAAMSNLAKALELALNDGKCRLCGQQYGPRTGDPRNFGTFAELLQAFEKQIAWYVAHMVQALNTIERVHSEICPQPFASLVTKGCVEKGQDFTRGGPVFNYTGPQGVGLADVADSLAAIRKFVFEEKTLSIEELLAVLDADFGENEPLRQVLLAAPKYGNDDDSVDDLARYVARVYCSEVSKYRNTRGGHYRPGMYAVSSNVPLGLNVGALPSGRKAKEPLADGGLSVKHGMDRHGPTAAVKSVAKVDHALSTNGTLLNQKFHPSALDSQEGREKLATLIRTYFALGGNHIQFNCIDADTLRDAKKHPEKYRSLVVRVAGYSAYFVDLDPGVQDDIIARTEFRAL